MHKYYLNISFPNINMDKYVNDINPFPKQIKSELIISNEEIILNIFVDEFLRNWETKLFYWIGEIDDLSFGQEIKIQNVDQNEDILNIDFLGSKIISAKSRNENNVTKIYIDKVKIYQHSALQENKAYAYLCGNGFNFIKQFYGSFYPENDVFKHNKIFKDVYQGYKCKIYPHFSHETKWDRNSNKIEIIKIPQLNFDFYEYQNEEIINKIISSTLESCSFFIQQNINIKSSYIHLKNTRIISYNVIKSPSWERVGSFSNFGIKWYPNDFLSKDWYENAFNNYDILNKVIPLFNQSLMSIGNRSKFLIRFNILEICSKGEKFTSENFHFRNEQSVFNDISELLLDNLPDNEKEIFQKKWNSISGSLKHKSMNNSLKRFLTNKKLPTEHFPVSVKELVTMRNNITHGSGSIDEQKLAGINILLYRISGILILDMLGIDNWELNLFLPKRLNLT